MITLTCIQCKSTFEKEGRKTCYCSVLCRLHAYRAAKTVPEDVHKTLPCIVCSKPFHQTNKRQKYCGPDCRAIYHTNLRATKQTANIARVYYDPQPGDLVESAGSFRWIVGRGVIQRLHPLYGLAKRPVDCVTFRNLPSNEEQMIKLTEWKNWCKARNGNDNTQVHHVLTRKDKPVFAETEEAVIERQAAKAFHRQFNLKRGVQ
jgi:hypothetical protein